MMETKDLILRKADFSDWVDLYENVWRHEETARYMLWSVTKCEEDAKNRMERTLAWQKDHHAWTVYLKKTGKAIGFAGLMELDDGSWEDTGVALGPAYTGKGLGKQILRELMDYVFETQKGSTLVCSCRSENGQSRGVMLSCGMMYTHSENRIDERNGATYTLEFYRMER